MWVYTDRYIYIDDTLDKNICSYILHTHTHTHTHIYIYIKNEHFEFGIGQSPNPEKEIVVDDDDDDDDSDKNIYSCPVFSCQRALTSDMCTPYFRIYSNVRFLLIQTMHSALQV
jgi:hypothetical protein